MRRIRMPLAVSLLLGACGVEPVETERRVPGPRDVVAGRVEAELTRLGFRVTRPAPGAIEATSGNAAAGWASCSPILVGAGDDRRVMAGAERRSASVRVALRLVESATSVMVDAAFAARYTNPTRGSSFERACRSRGSLERELLTAAGG